MYSNRKILLAEDTIDAQELHQLASWLQSGTRLTKGPLTLDFERAFAQYIGTKHAIFVNSGSSANLLIAYALLKSGHLRNNVVIAPTVAWVTTIAPFMQFGFEVKLCDCNATDLGFDLDAFEAMCEQYQPACAILVHVLGHATDMDRLLSICKRHDVHLIEDTCEALGSEYKGQKLGSLGLAGSFSFYYGHHISTIEGGMVVLNDSYLFNVMLSIRSHGWARDLQDASMHAAWTKEYGIDEVRDLYTFYFPGFNLRSTDLNAFLGLSQLKKLESLVHKRESNFLLYRQLLPKFWSQQSPTSTLSSFAYGLLVQNRLETCKYLTSHGIESRPLICGSLARHPFWTKEKDSVDLPMASIVHDHGIYLPNHGNLSTEDIHFIADKVNEVAKPLFF
ncbi:MAG: aminotransferase DegT [Verrucomicrobia bacterium GWF2_51_19]|nr:MAG: aminotransferase DegT [Verrucomicrobia bacterium GWF2_51_19]HCJ11663.1 aminotransferase DegT [Opitutae bacterium]